VSENHERVIQPVEIQTFEHQPYPALNPQDLAQLGAMMVTAGLTTLQARALVAKVQQAAAQTALMLAPDIMEEVRKVQEARMLTILQQVQILQRHPVFMNYIRRDQVLQIIQMVMSTVPRQ
jgi:uncharacterized Fe-S center protein